MAAPSLSWQLIDAQGTWNNQDGSLKAGTYKVTVPVEITSQTDRVKIPAGVFKSGPLNITAGSPSFAFQVPCTDDPDNNPQPDWKLLIEINFSDGSPKELYSVYAPYADRPTADGGTGDGIDMVDFVAAAIIPQANPAYRIGVPGGLARYNDLGQLIDAAGTPVTGGGGTGAVDSVNGLTGAVSLGKSDVGLPLADNTADINKAVASAAKLTTGRTIALDGDLSGEVSFDGSANVALTATFEGGGATGKDIVSAATQTDAWTALGTVPTGNLPPAAIPEVYEVANQTARLTLVAQKGDMAKQLDTSTWYVLSADNPAVDANWKPFATPSVQSVAGKAGVITLAAADISDSTTTGRALMKAATQQAARDAIGAGDSGLSLGTTSTTAKAGNYTPSWTEVQAVLTANSTNARAAIAAGFSNATWIPFSAMAGATDDDKLAAAAAMTQASTLKGREIILDENRDYTFTRQFVFSGGFALRGAFRSQDQPRSSRPVGNRILLRMAGSSSGKGWLKAGGTGNNFGLWLSGLSIDADINSSVVDGTEDTGAVLQTFDIKSVSVQNAKSFAGSKANRLLVTAGAITGWANLNNIRETAWNLGGSDFYLTPDLMLVDSPPELLGFNEYLMSHNYMSNAWFSNVYCTAEGHSAILIAGSNSTSQNLFFEKFVLEGRNENQPSPGALVRQNQGQTVITRSRFAFAMANPALITSRTDKGVIHVQGGHMTIDSCTYERGYTVSAWAPPASPTLGAAVAESVPFAYFAAGSKGIVRNIIANGPTTGDRAWTGKPIVKQALPGLVSCDDTVTLVTAAIAGAPNAAGDTTTGSANTGTSVTINKPANVVDGDLLIAAVYSRAASAVYTTPPSGWTAINPPTDNTAAGVVRLYWKIAASEGSSYTWAGGGSGRHTAILTRVTGSTTTPTDVAGNADTAIGPPDRIILPAMTTTSDLDALIMVGTANGTGGTSPTFTVPSPGSVIASVQTTTGASESSMTLAIETAVAVGATGTRVMTASGTSSTGVGYMAAIKSAG